MIAIGIAGNVALDVGINIHAGIARTVRIGVGIVHHVDVRPHVHTNIRDFDVVLVAAREQHDHRCEGPARASRRCQPPPCIPACLTSFRTDRP